MKIPVLIADKVFHIGTLDAADRGVNFKSSQEGHLLSVSTCPDAWEKIAKLGGNQWHELTAPGSLMFLDVYATLLDEEMRDTITTWGLENGLCAHATMWKKWEFDPENEEWRYQTFATEQAALDEIDEYNDDGGPDGGPTIEGCEMIVGTEQLGVIALDPNVTQRDSLDFVSVVWAERSLPQIHGVWWSEELDVHCCSAPRGGIFPGKVKFLSAVEVPRFISDPDLVLLEQSQISTRHSNIPKL